MIKMRRCDCRRNMMLDRRELEIFRRILNYRGPITYSKHLILINQYLRLSLGMHLHVQMER